MAKHASARSSLIDEYIVNIETRDVFSTISTVDSLTFVFEAITMGAIVLYTAISKAHDFVGEMRAKFSQAESTSDPPNYGSLSGDLRS
jgi:hypothetical protein